MIELIVWCAIWGAIAGLWLFLLAVAFLLVRSCVRAIRKTASGR